MHMMKKINTLSFTCAVNNCCYTCARVRLKRADGDGGLSADAAGRETSQISTRSDVEPHSLFIRRAAF